MKILCLSDLHRVITDTLALEEQNSWIASLMLKYFPDAVLITGDIFESELCVNPYENLHQLFDDIPVICTLGNHEFVYMTVDSVLKNYRDQYNPEKYNIHYLDVIGHYDINNVRFFGNVLWYDGTMATIRNQVLADFADGRWLDRTIVNFNPVKECGKCIEQILKNQPDEGQTGILCTHCVPAVEMNGHYQKGVRQPFDAFSGVTWLLKKVKCDSSISGHTHKRIIGKKVEGVKCFNVGNDYYPPFEHYLLEI